MNNIDKRTITNLILQKISTNEKIIYLSLCAVVSMLSACTYDEDIEEIMATQKALQDAYNAGKLITDVSPKGELNDWLITFSDNTSITINSGRDGENGVDGINGTLYVYTWPNSDIMGSYQNEVQNMKNWLSRRFEWLNTAFSAL